MVSIEYSHVLIALLLIVLFFTLIRFNRCISIIIQDKTSFDLFEMTFACLVRTKSILQTYFLLEKVLRLPVIIVGSCHLTIVSQLTVGRFLPSTFFSLYLLYCIDGCVCLNLFDEIINLLKKIDKLILIMIYELMFLFLI